MKCSPAVCAHITICTAAAHQDAEILMEDFNLQQPQSTSGLIKEAAERGNGLEVKTYNIRRFELSCCDIQHSRLKQQLTDGFL